MSETKLCCNCLHCARWKRKNGIECHCDLTDKYLGYLQVMDEDNNCQHWEKETKWDLQREHDKQIRSDAINAIKNDLHKRLTEEMNNPYQDQSLCRGLLYGIQRCDWYLDDSKENEA